jgi:hypothetical protein
MALEKVNWRNVQTAMQSLSKQIEVNMNNKANKKLFENSTVNISSGDIVKIF